MKMRKGYKIIWSDGTEWIGDCPVWAEKGRKAGHKVITIKILGQKLPCACSIPGLTC